MSYAPESYSRRILLAVTGMSPQIVTETLWALAVRQDPLFVPTEIHVVTTSEGAERVRLQLLAQESGYFHRLRADYRLPEIAFGEEHIHIIANDAGPLSDIRTPADNEAAADYLTTLVQSLTQDPNAALHVSLAGGRKTMGYYLGYALSLFGRPQDRLSHVLVSEGYESSPLFFYPTPAQQIIYVGPQQRPLDTAKAEIDLAVIPFVRLREDLPPKYLHEGLRFSDVIGAANRALQEPLLEIDLAQGAVFADGQLITQNPLQVALCWWLAEAAQSGEPAVDWTEPVAADAFLSRLRRLVPEMSSEYEKAEEALAWRRGDPVENKGYFAPLRTRTGNAFETVLGPSAASRYAIRQLGQRGREQFYGFTLEPAQIVLRSS
ncbi:CRISPR-associated ring nuclease Csm6 [Acidithiobacillus caldus]